MVINNWKIQLQDIHSSEINFMCIKRMPLSAVFITIQSKNTSNIHQYEWVNNFWHCYDWDIIK